MIKTFITAAILTTTTSLFAITFEDFKPAKLDLVDKEYFDIEGCVYATFNSNDNGNPDLNIIVDSPKFSREYTTVSGNSVDSGVNCPLIVDDSSRDMRFSLLSAAAPTTDKVSACFYGKNLSIEENMSKTMIGIVCIKKKLAK